MNAYLLFLGDVPQSARLADIVGAASSKAENPARAAFFIAARSPDAIIFGAAAPWPTSFAAALPPARRPQVVAVGEETRGLFGVADRWLPSDANDSRIGTCLSAAINRTRNRSLSEREEFRRDAETGLPNPDGFISALIAENATSKLDYREFSLALLHTPLELMRAAKILRSITRRDEITARIGPTVMATLIRGDKAVASRAATRLMLRLAGMGIASFVAVSDIVDLRSAVRSITSASRIPFTVSTATNPTPRAPRTFSWW